MRESNQAGEIDGVPLNRERVLQAAIALADASGIAGLSMRKLGSALGVEAMSLYHHVANKEEILTGILEMVMAEIELPPPGVGWQDGIRTTAISSHRVLLRHQWACALMMQPGRDTPSRFRWMEAVLRTFREAGFSAKLTHHAYHALDAHITGFTLWIVNLPVSTGQELRDMAAEVLPQFPVAEYPYLVEHINYHLHEPAQDDVSEFEFGLGLILDGLERLRQCE